MSQRDRPGPVLLARVLAIMLLASIAIRLMPFPRLARGMAATSRALPPAPASVIASLRRAIEAWARRLPWRTLCFEQGLTAHWLLGRAGYASTLFYGAAMGDRLHAHVWVRSGPLDVIGCEDVDKFAILSHFSNGSSS